MILLPDPFKIADSFLAFLIQNNTNDPVTQRAYHPDELIKDTSLKIGP